MWNNILIWLGLRMNKFWIVYSPGVKKSCRTMDIYGCYSIYDDYCGRDYYSDRFNTLVEAQNKAKELSVKNLGTKYTILEAMSETIPPIPEVEFKTLTSATPA